MPGGSMEIEAVKVRRLYLQVAEQLSSLMREGTLQAGDRLPSERDLASQFGVSRPTVREAMITLEIAGMVEIRSGSGVYVLKTSAAFAPAILQGEDPGPLEILEARKAIEGETAALAAQRIDADTLAELEKQLALIASENSSAEDKERADEQFHELIALASGNSALQSSVNWLWDLRNRSEISNQFHEKLRAEGSTPVVRDHARILEAIREKDSRSARKHMHKHLQRVLDYVLQ
jgi:GntR family transcriptional repressor for pyruvate dehydrogenase complex